MGGQITRHNNSLYGSVPIAALPSASIYHRHAYDCSVPITAVQHTSHHHHHYNRHHKPIDCPDHNLRLPNSWRRGQNVRLTDSQPRLLFHPTMMGSQIIMDESQRIVSRRGSFCNAIVFSDRCVAVNEVVRLKVTHTHHAWQGALRIGFTTEDPSGMDPKCLPRYSCPDLTSMSGFWAKPLPEELVNSETVISFWVTKKGRVLYRINESTPKRLFRLVRANQPLWVLVDVYGKTRGVQLLDSVTLPPDVSKNSSTRSRLMSQKNSQNCQLPVNMSDMYEEGPEEDDHNEHHCADHMPQNSQNLRLCSELPEYQDDELRIHYVYGKHVHLTDPNTAVMLKQQYPPGRCLVFTSRPLEHGESVFVLLQTTRSAELYYGVTACDPATLQPQEMPGDLLGLLDRPQFWAFECLSSQLLNEDILSFELNAAGQVVVQCNGINLDRRLCVDNSRPLWMFFAPKKNIKQLRIFGLSSHPDIQAPLRSPLSIPSVPRSPLSVTNTPAEPNITSNRPLNSSLPSSTGSPVAADQLVQSILSSRSSALSKTIVVLPSKRHNRFRTPPLTETQQNAPPSSPSSPQDPDECAICCDYAADTVLYDCGHLCLCYTCAFKLKRDQASCPICRKPIRDIIKTYRNS